MKQWTPELLEYQRKNICQPENKLELEPKESRRGEEVQDDIATSPELFPPAVIVSTEASPSMVRSAEKRRQSWIAGRYKLFNTATDDLLKNTPSKLKSFFHRVLRVQTHFDPSKQKKVKDGPKQRSASQLKSFSVFDPQENGSVVTFVEKEGSYPCPPHSRRFLRRKSSGKIVTSESGSKEDSVDGNCSPRNLSSESALSLTSASTLQRPTSPNSLELTRSSPSTRNRRVSDTLVDNSNRPRYKSIPVCNDDKSAGPVSRRTKSQRECPVNNANHLTPEVHADDAGGIKNRKSPFCFFF